MPQNGLAATVRPRRALPWALGSIVAAGVAVLLAGWQTGLFTARDSGAAALDYNAFAPRADEVPVDRRKAFDAGALMFTRHWIVRIPGPDVAFDGLGPVFNQTACTGCHVHGGRGGPEEGSIGTMIVRLSSPDGGEDPRYGRQLNDKAIPGVPPEGQAAVEYEERAGKYGDGGAYRLVLPRYRFSGLAFGPLDGDLVSGRVAPAMMGLGLLDAVPVEALEAMADPADADEDGISGRVNWGVDGDGYRVAGRFGWKADAPWLRDQAGQAGLEDMGLTNKMRPKPNCAPVQAVCQSAAIRPRPDMSDNFFDDLVTYLEMTKAPTPRETNDARASRGEALFRDLGCAQCHVPSLRTGPDAALPELRDREFHPFTDLLLHDMGEGLADHRPEGAASGTEWRTAPLWGLGLMPSVNGQRRLLHDGRARGIAEAILWHGGEAERAREAFRLATADDRSALIAFLETL